MARRFAYLIVWLSLTQEVRGETFSGMWETPLTPIGDFLFRGAPLIHLFPWDVMVLVTLALSWSGMRRNRVEPLFKSIRIAVGFIGVLWLWGVAWNHGSAYQTIFQLHPFVMGLVTTYMLVATCKTVAHFETLGKVIVFATLYRVFILFAFYFAVVRHLPYELPMLTSHADSTLFSTGLLILVIYAVERRTNGSALMAIFGTIAIGAAIQFNNRRLAWAGVIVGFIFLYLTMPKDRLKRRLNITLAILSPLIAAYVAAGWGHPTGIFKPVGSISTLFGTNQDVSSIMRDIENYNLTRTLKSNPILGIGWGNEYHEEVVAYSIKEGFPQYRYMPHNSYLGMLAFTGWIGFAGITQVFVVASFFLARTHRAARGPVPRTAALAALAALVMFLIYAWGDVGIQGMSANTMAACSLAVAARLPVLMGTWPWPAEGSPKARNHV